MVPTYGHEQPPWSIEDFGASVGREPRGAILESSLFTTVDARPAANTSLADRYGALLEQVVLAEQLGFGGFWVAEHHASNVGRIPNPAVLLAAAAAKTTTIRLGPAVSVLPLRCAALVAEDYAMLDVLSQGRLNMGVGAGSQRSEFDEMGVDFEQRRALFDDHLAELVRAWTPAEAGATHVRPVQPVPPIYVATLSEQGAYRAGSAGHSILTLVTPAVQDLEEIQARMAAHTRGLEEHGGAPGARAVVTFFCGVAEDEDEALERAATSMGNFVESSSGVRPSDPRALCESMRARGTGVFCAEDRVSSELERIGSLGIEHACFFVDFGMTPCKDVERTMRCLARARPPAPSGMGR